MKNNSNKNRSNDIKNKDFQIFSEKSKNKG